MLVLRDFAIFFIHVIPFNKIKDSTMNVVLSKMESQMHALPEYYPCVMIEQDLI